VKILTPHSLIGASSMHRWSKCPGSIRLIAALPRNSETASSYAEEGSDAHALAALCLRGGSNPGAHIGKPIFYEGRRFTPSRDMALAVQLYIDDLDHEVADTGLDAWRGVFSGDEPAETVDYVETRFDLSGVYPGCYGTADHVRWFPDTKLIHVRDYKHGAGLPVEVEGNVQLMYYGLGALHQLKLPAKRIKLTIVQPRCEHPDGPVRSWEIDTLDLVDFQSDLKAYAEATASPTAPLVPGAHCRYCPAARSCPALENQALEIAKAEFSVLVPYDAAKLGAALDTVEALEARIKSIREFAYAEAEAGRAIPGWKLVAKRAHRKWRDAEIIAAIPELFADVSDAYEPPTLLSPAQMEKLLGKGKVDKFVLAESSGHALVPEWDKRTAVRLPPPDEFTRIAS
jgi:hypothetical protein